MVKFSLFDEYERMIGKIDAGDDLPEKAASIVVDGPFDSNKSSYKILTTMLENSQRKLEKVKLRKLSSTLSPEFLAFLVLLCNKGSSLKFEDCSLCTNAMSCLMGALMTRGGIRSLSFYMLDDSLRPILSTQAKILMQGIASSPCLESLNLNINVAEPEEVGRCLIQALRRNKSLNDITLNSGSLRSSNDPTLLPIILKASILGPNMKSLSIHDYSGDSERDLPFDVLQDALSHKECCLEKLNLDLSSDISTEDGYHTIVQNSSVKSLKFSCLSDSDKVAKILSLFKSLEEIDISGNTITRLSFLDPLLVGERCRLKSLKLSNNDIDKQEMMYFIEKLRKTSGLKHLAICENPVWQDRDSYDVVNNAMMDVLRQSTDLEHVDFDGRDREDLLLDLNRGGRRIFESPFPRNLLPQVLERASKISYYNEYDSWGNPTNTRARVDVVFWMIQQMAPQL